MAIIQKNAAACGLTSWHVTVSGSNGRFDAVATLSGAQAGTATWAVTGGKATATDALARTIAAGCTTG